jgi:hypothetical protein
MQQQPPKNKVVQDEWGTTTREAYEDRPVFQQPRKRSPQRKGSGFLKSLGGLMILGAIFWGTYLVTGGAEPSVLWKASGPGPLCALGVVVSVLGKYIR